jgi:hypothetical protein
MRVANRQPTGSFTRPERFNLRLDKQTWARTSRLFAKAMAAHGYEARADAWEALFLPILEDATRDLPPLQVERHEPDGQALLPLAI